MNKYSLKIAGYLINFERETGDFSLNPSPRFMGFISENLPGGTTIKVCEGECQDIENARVVFSAPYVEEINGSRLKVKAELWEILRDQNNIYIRTTFPLEGKSKLAVLSIPGEGKEWRMWIRGGGDNIDPLAYPMDGLLLYYLASINGDIMIHGAGISDNGYGYIFSGVSGAGKSTMAGLWKAAGALVVHDDRLIIRKSENGYLIHNTPVYENEKPESARLDKIFLIGHGDSNQEDEIRGAVAVTSVLSNCIQHNWDRDMVDSALVSVRTLSETIPISRLKFLPDPGAISFIRNNDGKRDTSGIKRNTGHTEALKDIGLDILASGTAIQVSANGYSMYPTIKPGGTIVITKTDRPVPGDIIVISKGGKMVVHRLIKIIEEDKDIQFVARGDSNRFPDPPMAIENIVGQVAYFPNKPDIGELRYTINRLMARMVMVRDKIKKRLL